MDIFFLKDPPKEDIPVLEYRTINSVNFQNPSQNLIDTISSMENIQDWMREYLINEGYDKLSFVGSLENIVDVQQIVNRIREDLNISVDWYDKSKDTWDSFKKLRQQLQKCGVLVMLNGVVGQNNHRKLDIEEFRAFTLIDEYAPLIFINSNDSYNGRLFSLVHEVVHIWLGSGDLYNDAYYNNENVSPIEKTCNEVTAEILIPNNIFTKQWLNIQEKDTILKIELLANIFKCSNIVVARKALDKKYIDYNLYLKIVKETVKHYKHNKGNKESGGDYYNTLATRFDNKFLLALDNSMHEGKTLFTDAYRLTNTNRVTFSKLIDKLKEI